MPGTQPCPSWAERGGIHQLPLVIVARTVAAARWVSWSYRDASPSKALLQTNVRCRRWGRGPGGIAFTSAQVSGRTGNAERRRTPTDFPCPLVLADRREAEVRKGGRPHGARHSQRDEDLSGSRFSGTSTN